MSGSSFENRVITSFGLLVSGNYAPSRPICEKKGNLTISSPKWPIRSLVTPKKTGRKNIHRRPLQESLNFFNTMKKNCDFCDF